MSLLDAPAELVERILGVAIQYDLAKKYPNIYGSPKEVLQNVGAAYKVGSVAWESGAIWKMIHHQEGAKPPFPAIFPVSFDVADALGGMTAGHTSYILRRVTQNPFNILPALNEIALQAGLAKGNLEDIKYLDPQQTFDLGISPYPIPVDAVGAALLYEARKRIVSGENAEDVMMEYRSSLGMVGTTAELVGHILIDPLNRWGDITKYAGAGVAKVTGHKNLARTLMTKGVPSVFEGLKIHQEYLKSGLYGTLAELTPTEQRFIGYKEGFTINQRSTAENWAKRNFTNLFKRTPISAAEHDLFTSLENIGLVLDPYLAKVDPVGGANRLGRIGEGSLSAAEEFGVRMYGSPDMVSVETVMRQVAPDMQKIAQRFVDTGRQRAILETITEVLGTTKDEVIKRFGNLESAETLRNEFVNKLTGIADDNLADPVIRQKAVDLLEAIKPAEGAPGMTTSELKMIFDTYSGKDPAPYDVREVFGSMVDSARTKAEEYLAGFYGIKPDVWHVRLTRLFKRLQSVALLGWSTTYPLGNGINNEVTMGLEVGFKNLGWFESSEMRNRFWSEFGVQPARLKAGIGFGLIEEEVIPGEKGTYQSPIRKAARAGKGDIIEMAEKVARKLKMPSTELAQKMEKSAGQRAAYAGTKRALDGLWSLRKERFVAGNDEARFGAHADTVESAIRNNINKEGMVRDLTEGVAKYDIAKGIDEAANSLAAGDTNPKAVEWYKQVLSDTLDLIPGIKERIQTANNKAEFDAIKREIIDKMEDIFDDHYGQDIKTRVEEAVNRTNSGGIAESLSIINESRFYSEIYDIIRKQKYSEAWIENDKLTDVSARRALWDGVFGEMSRIVNRKNNWDHASMKGIFDGLGLEKTSSKRYLAILTEQQKLWDDFFFNDRKMRSEFYKKYSDVTRVERDKAYHALEEEITRLKQETDGKTAEAQNRR